MCRAQRPDPLFRFEGHGNDFYFLCTFIPRPDVVNPKRDIRIMSHKKSHNKKL